eukprot:TRINITY_DN40939_c0_g1_i1.p1 TRINITY_DN40939_c0_g1~~TRINITY_DN40939_c0_g1_i1.p1  ORF type:complete len:104 (+),score=10.81 TRINITY_DN40939_c0_g1_i1:14-325(+)
MGEEVAEVDLRRVEGPDLGLFLLFSFIDEDIGCCGAHCVKMGVELKGFLYCICPAHNWLNRSFECPKCFLFHPIHRELEGLIQSVGLDPLFPLAFSLSLSLGF